MDLNEAGKFIENRHPWELSRTKCTLAAFDKYLKKLHEKTSSLSYINIGAGDLYFDRALLNKYPADQVHAVDIAYPELGSEGGIHRYHRLEQISAEIDYVLMMDSLEYMEDDVAYLKSVMEKLPPESFFFLTLPAFPFLFSEYDINIKNLRRYDKKSISAVVKAVPGLEIIERYNFYTSLFLIRFFQKCLRLKIDPERKFTANWPYKEKNFLTRFLVAYLNLDFYINRLLSRIGIRLPGLSMLVILRVSK